MRYNNRCIFTDDSVLPVIFRRQGLTSTQGVERPLAPSNPKLWKKSNPIRPSLSATARHTARRHRQAPPYHPASGGSTCIPRLSKNSRHDCYGRRCARLVATPVVRAHAGVAGFFPRTSDRTGPSDDSHSRSSSSGDTWKTTVERYRDRFACHVITLAGFAGVPPIPSPLLASARTEIADYIRAARLDRPVIVGHSLGGTLALAIASDHPDRSARSSSWTACRSWRGQFQAKTLDDASGRGGDEGVHAQPDASSSTWTT